MFKPRKPKKRSRAVAATSAITTEDKASVSSSRKSLQSGSDIKHYDADDPSNNNNSSSSSSSKCLSQPKAMQKTKIKKRMQKKTIALSFDFETCEEEIPKNKKRRSREKKKSFGYGGAPISIDSTTEKKLEETSSPTINNNDVNLKEGSSSYGKDAMERLKREQKSVSLSTVKKTEPSFEKKSNKDEAEIIQVTEQAEDYISLRSNNNNADIHIHANADAILTGDEAFTFIESGTNNHKNNIPNSQTKEQQQEEEDTKWEEQISKRVGIRSKTTSSSSSVPVKTSSMQTIQQTFLNSISNIQNSLNEVQTTTEKQNAETTQIQTQLQKLETELRSHQSSQQIHSEIRSDLIPILKELRPFQSKVVLVRDAIMEFHKVLKYSSEDQYYQLVLDARQFQINHDTAENYHDHDADHISINDYGDTAVGQVDEFGRNTSNAKQIETNQRIRKRAASLDTFKSTQTLMNDNAVCNAMALFLVSHQDEDDTTTSNKQQRIAFSQAIQTARTAATTASSTHHTLAHYMIEKLSCIQNKWMLYSTEEYKNCYAEESILEIMGVFVLADLLERFDWIFYKEHPHIWKSSSCKVILQGITTNTALQHKLLIKTVIPYVKQIIQKGYYNPFSLSQTQSLTAFFSEDEWQSAASAQYEETLMNCFQQAANQRHLVDILMTNLDKDEDSTATSAMEEEILLAKQKQQQLLVFIYFQIYQWKNLIRNICQMWLPVLQQKIVVHDEHFLRRLGVWILMDIIGLKFLTCLRFLKQHIYYGSKKRLLQQVFSIVKDTIWWHDRDMMLYTLPFRDALREYDLGELLQ